MFATSEVVVSSLAVATLATYAKVVGGGEGERDK
jgi:hypothetical protein